MRTVTVQFDVYKFSELQEMAQNIAKENLADELDCNVDEVTQDDLEGYEYYWNGQIYKYDSNEVKPTMKIKREFMEAIYNVLFSSPDQVVMNANSFLSWYEKEYDVKLDARINFNKVESFAKVEEKIYSIK
jgi:uncharacterized protein involved in tolerance to divalent cations